MLYSKNKGACSSQGTQLTQSGQPHAEAVHVASHPGKKLRPRVAQADQIGLEQNGDDEGEGGSWQAGCQKTVAGGSAWGTVYVGVNGSGGDGDGDGGHCGGGAWPCAMVGGCSALVPWLVCRGEALEEWRWTQWKARCWWWMHCCGFWEVLEELARGVGGDGGHEPKGAWV